MDSLVERLVKVVPSERQIKWQQLEFTAFLHYGINSFYDREWGTGKEDISVFHPKNLDTDQWCEALKAAEIKACIITAKHHDGFCLWDTAYTDHSVMHTPFKRDIVAELAKSCKKYGLKFGVYLSPWDRHEESYGKGKEYDDFFCGQLTELLTNYGEIYTVWFDGACGEGKNGKKQIYDWDRYYKVVRSLQPEAVISICGPDVRWCGNEAGECRESEWSVVPASLFSQKYIQEHSQQEDSEEFRQKGLTEQTKDLGSREVVKDTEELIWYPAEVDVSIRPGWFHHDNEDDKVKSLEVLKEIYLQSVGGNSVLLLNIPPHRDGYITEQDRTRLQELGDFIRNDFKDNLITSNVTATSTDKGTDAKNIVSHDESYWKSEDYIDGCRITVDLGQPKEIKYVVLQEQIRLSQRVESFYVEGELKNGKPKVLYRGTTIGYKRICPIEPIEVSKVHVVFEKFRKSPTLKHMAIY